MWTRKPSQIHNTPDLTNGLNVAKGDENYTWSAAGVW